MPENATAVPRRLQNLADSLSKPEHGFRVRGNLGILSITALGLVRLRNFVSWPIPRIPVCTGVCPPITVEWVDKHNLPSTNQSAQG
jgi:hypothetical protein